MTTMDWAERERLVIEMLKKEISPKEIAHQLRMSLRDVYKIRNKHFGKREEKPLTTEHQAIILFQKGKKSPEVSLELRISLEEATRYYIRYKDSYYLGKFGQDYKYFKGYMKELNEICYVMKNGGLKAKELVDEYHLARDLGVMEERQLEIMRGNEILREEKDTLTSEIYALRVQKSSLETQIKSLKPQVEELERRYSITYEWLTYPSQNPGYNYNYHQNTYPGQQYFGNIRYY